MRDDPYTQRPMEPARAGTETRDSRIDGLHAEAKAAVGYSANTLRSVRERYREAYADALGHWQALRDELDADDRTTTDTARSTSTAPVDRAADAAEAGADDARRRTLRGDVDGLTARHRRATRASSRGSSSPSGPSSGPGCSSSAATRPC